MTFHHDLPIAEIIATLNPRGKFTLEMNAKWLDSIRRYVLDVDARILDLHHLDLTLEEIKSILEFLSESQVSELDLSHYDLENQLDSLSKLLIKTKIKKLNLSSCKLTQNDVMSLMGILKDSQISDLNISRNKFVLREPECNDFMAFLEESHLISLNLGKSIEFVDSQDVYRFIDTLCKSSITRLNLDSLNGRRRFSDAMLSLLLDLKHTAITHLSLANNHLYSCYTSLRLGDSLRESKLIELDLSYNEFYYDQVDALFEALRGSPVLSLNLTSCNYLGFESFFPSLKETQITRFDLSKIEFMESGYMFGLSDTSLVSLQLNSCFLRDDYGVRIMKSLRSSKLEELDVGSNLFEDETLFELSRCLAETAITSVNISGEPGSRYSRNVFLAIAHLLGASKNSNVSSLKLRWFHLDKESAEIAFPNLVNTKLTHLDLGSNYLVGGLPSLTAVLKFTALTHLNLKRNHINDEDAKVLAECVQETCVSFLNLGSNKITDSGAVALALSLKGSNILSLKLKNNQIRNPALEVLASNTEGTFITTLKVSKNPGNKRIVETVIWNNRRSVLEFVRFFKQIVPQRGMNSFRFGDIVSTAEVDKFLDDCLNFYNIFVSNQTSAVLVLSQDEPFTVGQNQMRALLFDEFPRQLVQFIVTNIEAEVSEYVNFLKKVEEMGLTRIVELLLLNRPIYIIDESEGILHPYVYLLLNRYKLLICNLDVEPSGIERIVGYFTENKGINGADEVIAMLKCL